MIVLTCCNCHSTKLTKYEGKMADNGYDWFHCEDCKTNFPMRRAGYRQEPNLFE